jgi:hypothetical protein
VVSFNYVWKIHLSLLFFLTIRWLILLILETLISVLNFIFIIYLVLFEWEEKEEIVKFQARKKKVFVATIHATKTVDFCLKWLYMMRRVQLKCFFFFFTLKVPKTIWVREDFGFRVDLGFEAIVFFCILKVMNWFNKVIRVFF